MQGDVLGVAWFQAQGSAEFLDEFFLIEAQFLVAELITYAPNGAGVPEESDQSGSKTVVAGIHRISGIPDKMGKAQLMAPGHKVLLCTIGIRGQELRSMAVRKLFDNTFASTWSGPDNGAVVMMEYP